MPDETTSRILEALIEKEYERVRTAMIKLEGAQAQYGPGTYHLVKSVLERLFEDQQLLPHLVPHFLSDMVDHGSSTHKLGRYKTMSHFLGGPLNFLTSFAADKVLADLKFLSEGVDIGTKDSEGKPVKFSVSYAKDQMLNIIDNFESMSQVMARYARGYRDAFEATRKKGGVIAGYDESISPGTFVRDDRAELYAIIRTLSPGVEFHRDLPMDQEELIERYERIARKYITGPNTMGSEYSFAMQMPFDFLLSTAKLLVHVTGNRDHWSGIIRFGFQPKSYIHDTLLILSEKLGVDEELRKDVHQLAVSGDKWIDDAAVLMKQVINIAGSDIYFRQRQLINTLGKKEFQREIVDRYAHS